MKSSLAVRTSSTMSSEEKHNRSMKSSTPACKCRSEKTAEQIHQAFDSSQLKRTKSLSTWFPKDPTSDFSPNVNKPTHEKEHSVASFIIASRPLLWCVSVFVIMLTGYTGSKHVPGGLISKIVYFFQYSFMGVSYLGTHFIFNQFILPRAEKMPLDQLLRNTHFNNRIVLSEICRTIVSVVWISILQTMLSFKDSHSYLWTFFFCCIEPICIEMATYNHRITYSIMCSYVLVQHACFVYMGAPIDQCLGSIICCVLVIALCVSMMHFMKDMNRWHQKRVEEHSIQRSEDMYQLLYRTAPNAFLSVSPGDYKITHCNIAGSSIFGRTCCELYNTPLLNYFKKESRDSISKALKDCEKDEHFSSGCTPLYLKHICCAQVDNKEAINNENTIVSLFVNAIRTPDGKPLSYNIIIHDITEKINLMGQLTQEKEIAVQASKAKSNFLAVMSHELKTPLNAVLGMTDLLLLTKLDAVQQEYVSTISHSSKLLLNLIQDILDFSKIEAGKVELEKIPFDLSKIIEQISTGILLPQAQKKGLHFWFKVDESVHRYVIGDENRLTQVILNLCNNAIKFTNSGEVSLSIENDTSATTESLETDCLRIRGVIRDTGIGIAVDKIDALFDSFKQADTSTTRKHGGSGLGLVISKQLLELMNGSISVTSSEGKGSTFTFTAEFKRATKVQVERRKSDSVLERYAELFEIRTTDNKGPSKQELSLADFDKAEILFVDDNNINLKVGVKILNHLGYSHVCVAKNGHEAIAMYKKGGFNLLFVDLCMPVVDGFEVATNIREYEKVNRKAPSILIALTANSVQGVVEKCKACGFDFFLTKPTTMLDIKQTMDYFVKRIGQRDTTPCWVPQSEE